MNIYIYDGRHRLRPHSTLSVTLSSGPLSLVLSYARAALPLFPFFSHPHAHAHKGSIKIATTGSIDCLHTQRSHTHVLSFCLSSLSLLSVSPLCLSLSLTHTQTHTHSIKTATPAGIGFFLSHLGSVSPLCVSLSLTHTHTYTHSIKTATTAGIGFFLAHLGLQTAQGIGLVVTDIATG